MLSSPLLLLLCPRSFYTNPMLSHRLDLSAPLLLLLCPRSSLTNPMLSHRHFAAETVLLRRSALTSSLVIARLMIECGCVILWISLAAVFLYAFGLRLNLSNPLARPT